MASEWPVGAPAFLFLALNAVATHVEIVFSKGKGGCMMAAGKLVYSDATDSTMAGGDTPPDPPESRRQATPNSNNGQIQVAGADAKCKKPRKGGGWGRGHLRFGA